MQSSTRSAAAPWYRFGTRCIVLSVQIVHGPGHIGRDGRSGTHRHLNPLGWGPKGRWFKSSRPDLAKARFQSGLSTSRGCGARGGTGAVVPAAVPREARVDPPAEGHWFKSSDPTVRTHLRHIYSKLDVHGRGEAVERARELGLVAPSTRLR
jgi:hypothetical protein